LCHATSIVALPFLTSAPLISCFSTAPATTASYTLSLHDALPICWDHFECRGWRCIHRHLYVTILSGIFCARVRQQLSQNIPLRIDRKSTRLNSSHQIISYAVFCLKKKNIDDKTHTWTQKEHNTMT